MPKSLIAVTIIFVGIFCFYGFYIVQKDRTLFKIVKRDFSQKHPDYEFVECAVGEGDLAVVYIHVKFRKPPHDSIHEEVWQYWNTDSAWLHRDKYTELTKHINQ